MAFKTTKTTNTLSTQFRRSYLILCCVILVFFLFYTLQAILINNRSIDLDKDLLEDQKELRYLQLLRIHLYEQESYVKDYQYTGNDLYDKKAFTAATKIDSNLNKLKKNVNDEVRSLQLLHDIELLIDKRKPIISALRATPAKSISADDMNAALLTLSVLNDSINEQVKKLQNIESAEIIERTDKTRQYNYYRIIGSIIGYIVISILLIYTVFKINQNIRRRLLAEEKARINEKKYKTLVEDSGMKILVINNKGYIKFANKNIEQLSGYRPDEIIGMPVQKNIASRFRKNAEQVILILNKTGRYDNTVELQITTKHGLKKWVLCKVFPLHIDTDEDLREWQVVVWDIDEEKKIHLELELLEEERLQQQKLIQDIIDNIPSVIFIKDVNGRYLLINKKMEEVMGASFKKIVGATDKELIPDPSRYEVYEYTDAKVLETGQVATMEDMIYLNGKKHYLLVTKFPLFDEKGNVRNICGLATDITEQKESEIHLLNAKRDAEMAKAAQETFLANMSHEIRTPMNGIMGMANLLLSASLTPEHVEYVESIQDSGRNLLSIINDLLDFSKIRSGKFQFDDTVFKLKHTIKKALYPLQIRAEEKLLTLEMYFDDNVPDVVIGDPVRLQQIIINLAGNAVKFTSNGKIKVAVSCGAQKDKETEIRIEVTDSGIGIATEKLEYIFESFTQNNVNTSRRYGGTGLGLAIVKQLVELQNGTVSVESTLGKGSVFTVIIPFRIDKDAKLPDNKYVGISTETDDLLAGIRVLVAEDNLINQKVVLNTLKRKGAIVTMVFNGQDAIEQIKNNPFDIILMDLQMPEVDGYRATKYIRQVLKNNIPILAMTADAIKGEAEKCFEAGMTGFISKPFDPADLYMQILKGTGNDDDNTYIKQEKPTEDMQEPLIDFSFLHDISGNDPGYINDVIEIFLGSTPPGVQTLKEMIENNGDWDAIGKQAHFLKSSVSVIKIRGVYDQLAEIEKTAFKEQDMEKTKQLMVEILKTFEEAMPVLLQEKEKNKPTA